MRLPHARGLARLTTAMALATLPFATAGAQKRPVTAAAPTARLRWTTRPWGPNDPGVRDPVNGVDVLLTVVVRDALEPSHGVPGARVQLIPRFTTPDRLAGSVATSAGTSTAGFDITGAIDPPLRHRQGGSFTVRVEANEYRPLEVPIEIPAGCAPTLELWLQRGWRAGGDPPAPRAMLTTCRGPRPAPPKARPDTAVDRPPRTR